MSKRTKKQKTADPALAGAMERRRAIVAGSVMIAVVGTLIVAAVLQTRPEADSQVELPEPTHIEVGETGLDNLPADEGLTTDDPQFVPPPPSADALSQRGSADLRRLEGPGGDWTLQFANMCDPGHARGLVASLPDHEKLYLVPAGDCFKVWWGRFASRDEALAARGIPAALDSIQGSPFPRRISESLP